jgi:predicted MPP superfamily phosphohydrolase
MRHWLSRRSFLKILFGSAAAMTAMGAYAFGVEPAFRLRVQHYAPVLPRWPRDLALTVTIVADVHVGEPYMSLRRVEKIVAAANALGSDLILLLGDYAAGHRFVTRPVSLRECAGAFRSLEAPLGVYSILGNHDWWDDFTAQREGKGPIIAARALRDVHIPILENDVVRIKKGDRSFWLAGLGDQISYIEDGEDERPVADLDATLAALRTDEPAILLAHEPKIFAGLTDRFALTLSGHTHGGQVRLFGWSPISADSYGNRYAYGHVVENGRHLIVSGGLGLSKLPVRLGVPPEIVLVELGTDEGAA